MAYLNITINELVCIVKQNMKNAGQLKDINVVNENQLELVVSVGPFFPDIKARLIYNRFSEGRLYLSLASGGSVKVLIGLLNELCNKQEKDAVRISGQNVIIDVNKVITESVNGVYVKDINVVGKEVYINVLTENLYK